MYYLLWPGMNILLGKSGKGAMFHKWADLKKKGEEERRETLLWL